MNFVGDHKGIWKDIYGILSRGQGGPTGDGIGSHSVDDIAEVQELMYSQIKANRVASGETFQSLTEARSSVLMPVLKGLAKDGFYNPMTNIGTLQDPASYNMASIPVAISPHEGTSLYASGGLASIVIDKKSEGILLNGIGFKSNNSFWTDEKKKQLADAYFETGLDIILSNGIRDATIYGGAAVYPILKKDNIATFDMDFNQLLKSGSLKKDCVSHWAYADRWNMVFVPNFNITAEDYLFAKRYYIPISGVSINTERAAIIRPKALPYWGAIRQLGWSTSDFEGYMRSIYGYEIMIMSIPIMAQQMSLLLYQLPLDAMLANIGVDKVKQLMEINEQKMREWSVTNPKAVNMVGEVFTVDRSFSGFEHFVAAMKADVAAQCEIPEPVLFHTPSKGFSDNTAEALLKESQTIKYRQRRIEPQLKQINKIMIAHTWGSDSEEFKQANDIHLSFDKPIVATETEMAEVGARFAATVNSLKQAGIPAADAIKIAQSYFKSVEIREESLQNIEAEHQRQIELDKEDLEVRKNSPDPMGVGSKGQNVKAPQKHMTRSV